VPDFNRPNGGSRHSAIYREPQSINQSSNIRLMASISSLHSRNWNDMNSIINKHYVSDPDIRLGGNLICSQYLMFISSLEGIQAPQDSTVYRL